MTQDYLIQGLESPTLEVIVDGTGHFLKNVISAWYCLVQVELTADRVNMTFEPSEHLPDELIGQKGQYTLSVRPDPQFALTVSETDQEGSAYANKVVLLRCCPDDKGRLVFNYEIFVKTAAIVSSLKMSCIGASHEKLLADGYTLIATGNSKRYHQSILDVA